MKAILEFDIPESCAACPVNKHYPGMGKFACPVAETYSRSTDDYINGRAPFCPLQLEVAND